MTQIKWDEWDASSQSLIKQLGGKLRGFMVFRLNVSGLHCLGTAQIKDSKGIGVIVSNVENGMYDIIHTYEPMPDVFEKYLDGINLD